ncbi:hypothetical protein F442_19903, partial [Phytophthora nicotianae P10297]
LSGSFTVLSNERLEQSAKLIFALPEHDDVLDGEAAHVELKIVENGALWKEKRGVAGVNVVGGDQK